MQPAGRRPVVDRSVTERQPLGCRAKPRRAPRRCGRLQLGDTAFRHLTRAAAYLRSASCSAASSSRWSPARCWRCSNFGFGFLVTERWNPVTEKFGALAPIYGTIVTSLIAMLIAVPVGLMIALFLTELCPLWLRRPIGIAIELLAGIPSIIYGIWGLFVFAPFLQQTRAAVPDRRCSATCRCCRSLFAGPPYGIGMLTAGLILAIMVLPFITSISRDVFEAVPPVLKEAAYGLGCTTWEVVAQRRAALHPRRRDRRRHAGARPRARRDHGGHLRHRQRAPDLRLRSWRPARRSPRPSPTNSPKRSATSTPRR